MRKVQDTLIPSNIKRKLDRKIRIAKAKQSKKQRRKRMTWAKKYDNEDLLKVNRKELSIEDLMKKYNVSRNAIYMAFKHKGIQVKQKGVKIISPYGSKICKTRQECCDELGISSVSLWKALHGKRVAVLEELGIKLIDIENTENKNEDITN